MQHLNPAQFKKFFTSKADITCLHSDFLLHGSLAKADLFLTYRNGTFDIFLNKEKERFCLEKGVALFSNAKKYGKYIREFRQYVKRAFNYMIPKYSKTPKTLTKAEFKRDAEFMGKLWHYYGITEFPYIDLAYEHAIKTSNLKMKQRLDETSRFKFKGREVMNAYFFKNGAIENLLRYVSQNYLSGNDANYLYLNELLAVFNGKKPEKQVIEGRKKCYGAAVKNGKSVYYNYRDSLALNRIFTYMAPTSVLRGKTANPGKAKGRAVIMPLLNDLTEIKKIDKYMKKGDILIAETTSPDVMPLCKKASAIVADQGGLLSHAVIVCRELNIPCIIQTEKATKIFKTGDIVEVDAEKGIVKKVS